MHWMTSLQILRVSATPKSKLDFPYEIKKLACGKISLQVRGKHMHTEEKMHTLFDT